MLAIQMFYMAGVVDLARGMLTSVARSIHVSVLSLTIRCRPALECLQNCMSYLQSSNYHSVAYRWRISACTDLIFSV